MFLKEYKGEHAPHFGTSKETCSLTVSRLQLHQRYVSDKLTCQPHVALRLQNVVLQFASEIHSADIYSRPCFELKESTFQSELSLVLLVPLVLHKSMHPNPH